MGKRGHFRIFARVGGHFRIFAWIRGAFSILKSQKWGASLKRLGTTALHNLQQVSGEIEFHAARIFALCPSLFFGMKCSFFSLQKPRLLRSDLNQAIGEANRYWDLLILKIGFCKP
jgi:hypothetical protein